MTSDGRVHPGQDMAAMEAQMPPGYEAALPKKPNFKEILISLAPTASLYLLKAANIISWSHLGIGAAAFGASLGINALRSVMRKQEEKRTMTKLGVMGGAAALKQDNIGPSQALEAMGAGQEIPEQFRAEAERLGITVEEYIQLMQAEHKRLLQQESPEVQSPPSTLNSLAVGA
jgi:hypothetical protein